MDSVRTILSSYDELEFICEEHGLPCIGICSDLLCQNEPKLLCMKCVKSGKTCITLNKHELVSISELLLRYFINEEKRSKNINEVKNLRVIKQTIDEEKINEIIQFFSNIKNNNIFNNIEKKLTSLLDKIINDFKEKNNNKLKEIKDSFKKPANIQKDEQILFKMKFPEIDQKDFDNQKMVEFMNEGYKLSSPKELFNNIKFLRDSSELDNLYNSINKKVKLNNIVKMGDEEKKKKLGEQIDEILNGIEEQFDECLKGMEEKIIVSKNNFNVELNERLKQKFKEDPSQLQYTMDICSNAHNSNSIDSVFCAFKSFSGISYIVWGNTKYDIDFYDIEQEKVVKTIALAHSKVICSCRHYSDNQKSIDYVISSSYDKSVKLWNVETLENIVNIQNAHKTTNIYSVCLLCDSNNGENFVISSAPNEYMKIWNMNGDFVRNMGQNDESTYFIDVYYDNQKNNIYVLNANSSDVKSYTFSDKSLYKKYKGTPEKWHMSALVNTYDKEILIESDGDGNIRLWEFHTANLVKTIKVNPMTNLRGICLWNDDYLFAAGNDYKVKLFNLKEGTFSKSFTCHKGIVCSFQKIESSKYGECLISHGLDGRLKLWSLPKK